MAAVSGKSAVWRFGDVVVDTLAFRVTVSGEPCELEPKALRLLVFLIENRGGAVTKEEILQTVWGGTAVTDNALTRAVAQIRKALGDDARQPRYIETVPTVGYRFIAEVEQVPSQAPEVPATVVQPKTDGRHTWLRNRRTVATSAAMALAALAVVLWASSDRADPEFIRTAAAQVERFAAEQHYEQAHELAREVLRHDPSNAVVLPLMSELTDVLSVRSTPAGANVYLRRFGSEREDRLGVTPLEKYPVVRGEYILSVRKAGYIALERSVSSRLGRASPLNRSPWNLSISARLKKVGEIPDRMVAVDTAEHKLAAHSRTVDATVTLDPYFIDKYEVSNREYKTFVDAGGYNKPEFWEDASVAAALKDETGMNAPRQWVGGAIPDGKADHPVTGVTWHEAYAYCRFRGKTLPTVFQWEEAARANMQSPFGVVFPWGLLEGNEVSARANFEGSGTAPVHAFAFGMSPHGAWNMAGNVSEWMLNRYDDGYTTGGGGWNDPVYSFGLYQSRPALHSAATLGFRCALTAGSSEGDQGAMAFSHRRIDYSYPLSSTAAFEAAKQRYRYPKSPLNPKVIAVEHKQSWRREEIEFDGYRGKRARAFLYLPRNAATPYQTIHYQGGLAWWLGVPVTHIVEDRAGRLAPFLQSGRAVFLVVLEGFAGREPVGAYARLSLRSAEYRDILREWSIDMQRGVDYLLSRPDLDSSRIAFWNTSTTESGVIFAAVDGRYAALVLNGAEMYPRTAEIPADANPLHFAPHIRAPKLILTGEYDETSSRRVALLDPVFRLLRDPRRHVTYIGGHVPPNEIAVPLVNGYLDETLGKVEIRRP